MSKFYRNRALKDFKPISGVFQHYSYGANSITGWRSSQEDRYVCLPFPDFKGTMSFFGVYDGHGGGDVSEYLKRRLHEHIRDVCNEFGCIKSGLEVGFKLCDEHIRSMKRDEFKQIRGSNAKEYPTPDSQPSTSYAPIRKKDDYYMSEIGDAINKHMMELQNDLDAPISFEDYSSGSGIRKRKRSESKTPDPTTRLTRQQNKKTGKVDSTYKPPQKSSCRARLNKKCLEILSVLEGTIPHNERPLVGMTCGSTATALIITDHMIFVANVGDSRCIASVDGKLKVMSHDHRPQMRKENNRIILAGHKIIRGRIDGGLNMSRAFGDFGLKDVPNVRPIRQAVNIEPSMGCLMNDDTLDFIIIASDGIWNNLSNNTVRNFVAKNIELPLPEICAKVFEAILGRYRGIKVPQGKDNMTMIIIRNEVKYGNKSSIERIIDLLDSASDTDDNIHTDKEDDHDYGKKIKRLKV